MKLKYECPKCEVKSYSKYWNAETRVRYGAHGDICEIQEGESNSYHICPECKQESEMFKGNLIIGTTESA
jgi:RNA polymerase subunit RPABC4/transcription elongation factor Spt4